MLWLLMQSLVVQAYCAPAGAATENASKAGGKKYRNVFIASFATAIRARIILSSCRPLALRRADVHYHIECAKDRAALAGGGDDKMRCVPKDLLRAAQARLLLLAGMGMLTLLAACGQENRFIAPPPPKVTVQLPVQQMVTPYLLATGNAASVNTVKLVARVQGYVQEIKYQDGAAVKKGTPLFVIEPEPYKVQLEQAQAAEEGAKATLINAEAEFTRQQELQSKDVSTQANLDKARANRDTARANVLQAQANVQMAEINLGYTTVSAPFDGVVTARKVSVGELVGGDHTSELATIVQLDPIWVWFNLSERDVQRGRAQLTQQGVSIADLINKAPVEVGLQTEAGYPHKGLLDYVSPDVNQSTGTLQVRAIFENAKQALLPGYFVRVRVPLRAQQALLVPESPWAPIRPAATCSSSTPMASSSSAGCSSG